MALSYGCEAVWVGTRFVCPEEAGASIMHKEAILNATCDDTFTTEIYTGRPLRIVKNKYAVDWMENRQEEMKHLLKEGTIPYTIDYDRTSGQKKERSGQYAASYESSESEFMTAHLSGQVAGSVNDVKPAKQIVEEMISGAIEILQQNRRKIVSKL
eukprot:768665_1